MSRVISVIPAKPLQVIKGLPIEFKKRVCAYCRVSTDTDEQLTSYEAQVTYYEDYIKRRPDWEFAGIYADEGITGTNTKNRVEFNRMISDCMDGNIDMVITKSISRFARNTLDCLKFVRMLKEKGVAVYFEKENIDTMDTKGEVLLTILSSLAQDESRNISENSRWGIVRRFQQGKIRVVTSKFWGYDKDENGDLVINEAQAEIVQRIFREYLEGKGTTTICRGLEKDKIPTIAGGKKWHDSVIRQMLMNEKYCGDALLQKSITVDFLTHKRIKNRGQVQQFYVENNHPAIISKDTFMLVQEEIKRRRDLAKYTDTDKCRSRYANRYPFSGKIVCGNCGNKFFRKPWGTGKYRVYVWICAKHKKYGDEGCDMKAVHEKKLKNAFVRVVNRLIEDKGDFLNVMLKNMERVLSEQAEEEEIKMVSRRIDELKEELSNLVKLNLRTHIDSEIYDEEYNRIAREIEELREKKTAFDNDILKRQNEMSRLEEVATELQGRDVVDKFDEELFTDLVDSINIKSFVEVQFILKSGYVADEVL